jgi:hypothetical protein
MGKTKTKSANRGIGETVQDSVWSPILPVSGSPFPFPLVRFAFSPFHLFPLSVFLFPSSESGLCRRDSNHSNLDETSI